MGSPWDLILGDCLDPVAGLASLADRSVDHTIMDPPYSAALYERFRTNGRAPEPSGDRPHRPKERPRQAPTWQALAAQAIGSAEEVIERGIVEQVLRVTRRWVIIFSDDEAEFLWMSRLRGRVTEGGHVVRRGVAVKVNPMPQVSGDRPAQGHEPVIIAHAPRVKGGRMAWNGGGRPAVWTFPAVTQHDRPDHPCPKPLALMEDLVRDFTQPGELILDPFAGSGTTGLAALRHGRRFLGWERNPGWHAAAARRLRGVEAAPAEDRLRIVRARVEGLKKETAI